ncbi:uncharacterized protein A4U43_C07F36400 [Asparagus officinalis]|uniref:Methyltransferase n=1 Tax=Asparagus officinalis TaxID=4686 RepID=A0A5P1EKP2_ASPOF|nr:uncharacterized protein A4U43_C07F36400 [Asparagus officinalis]
MCPLRLILIFISATLAGYFAWKTVRSSPPSISDDDSAATRNPRGDLGKRRDFDAKKVIGDGFWGFVDMASGRYLWRAIKER